MLQTLGGAFSPILNSEKEMPMGVVEAAPYQSLFQSLEVGGLMKLESFLKYPRLV